MSRALVALDALRELTDGTPADLAALLSEVAAVCPIAGPWRESMLGLQTNWGREATLRTAGGRLFPALVEPGNDGLWYARTEDRITKHDTPESARDACDERLRALGRVLL